MKTLTGLLLIVLLAVLTAHPACAHVRGRGTLKVDLNKDRPTYDDFAFFIESYVHRNLYVNRYAKPDKRFYVGEFLSVVQAGPRAEVFFSVLDNKLKTYFKDSMVFRRNGDKVWVYRNEQGEDLPVYTYEKWYSYYYRTYGLQNWFGGAVLVMLAILYRMRGRRRVKMLRSIDQLRAGG
ncbi:MAG: hypothetical protein JXQ81_14310 [Desulfuromonadales bacterium]|nr:hypothetical protein [Desulfuromonadales bacterium]